MAAMGWFDRLVFVVFLGVGAVCNGSAMRQSFGNNDKPVVSARTVSIQDSVPPPTFLPGPSEVTVRQGEVAVLPCAVRHLGPKQVVWRRIDADFPLTIGGFTWTNDVRLSVDHIPRENDAGDWNLVIDTVTQDDVGVYKCQVTSKLRLNKLVELKVVGPPVRDPVVSARTVSIQDSVPPPTFLPGPSEVTVRQGEVAVLPCAVRHLGPKKVAWRRIDAHFPLTIGRMTWTDDVRFSVDHIPRENDAGDWNLVIDTVTQDDVGVYKCQVLSRLGLNKLVELKVVGPPVRDPGPPVRDPVISIKGRRYVDLGQEIHLVCNASGGPRLPEDIDWFKDGVKINSFRYPRVLIEEYQSIRDRAFISELMIDHAEESDAGVYVCRSSKNAVDSMKITVLKETEPTDTTRRETKPTDTTRRETKPTDPTRTGHTSIDIFRVTQSC
ncbi:limbic system-associated membrane protein-like isoform X4 [Babylonia areolata]|uniref:limbic system-associated membrane protein-like isoform X3 n=1 Tax=Babylonia areolata TaxID=304850 RepID=UPI003FD32863